MVARNTKFFHVKATRRKLCKTINGLKNNISVRHEDMGSIEQIVQHHFESSRLIGHIVDDVKIFAEEIGVR